MKVNEKPIDGATYFGQKLYEIRMQMGISQAAMGRIIGKLQGVVSKWEWGEMRASATDIVKVARALKRSPKEFLPSE